jgi:hypothetical protein
MRNRPLIPDFATVPRFARSRDYFLERHIAGRHFLRLQVSGGYFRPM